MELLPVRSHDWEKRGDTHTLTIQDVVSLCIRLYLNRIMSLLFLNISIHRWEWIGEWTNLTVKCRAKCVRNKDNMEIERNDGEHTTFIHSHRVSHDDEQKTTNKNVCSLSLIINRYQGKSSISTVIWIHLYIATARRKLQRVYLFRIGWKRKTSLSPFAWNIQSVACRSECIHFDVQFLVRVVLFRLFLEKSARV